MAAWNGWETQLLKAGGFPVTPRNVELLRGWQASEGGGARFNPLNTTTKAPGSTAYNNNGGYPVQHFVSEAQGIAANVKTIYNGHYPAIVAALKNGNASQQEFGQAVVSSPWGTRHGVVGQWAGGSGGASSPPSYTPSPAAVGPTPKAPRLLSASTPAPAGPSLNGAEAIRSAARQSFGDIAAGGSAEQNFGQLAQTIHDVKTTLDTMPKIAPPTLAKAYADPNIASNPTSIEGQAVKLAQKYMGIKYTFGGTTAKGGFDCSGLLQTVWKSLGVSIPRVTYDQWGAGKPVAQSDLRPGDAVFFRGSDPKDGKPGHVGMYMGGGKMIVAPHTGSFVQVQEMAGHSNYMGARRYA